MKESIDSLNVIINTTKSDSLKVDALLNLSNHYGEVDFSATEDLIYQAISIINSIQGKSKYWYDKEAVAYIKKAATKQKLSIKEINTPFKWGEDFGLFTQQYKGAMFGLGAGKNTPALHNPDYDFPDEITVTGAQLFYNILKEVQ